MIYVSCFMIFILIPSLLIAAGVVLAGRVIYKKIPRDIEEWNKVVAKEDFGPTFYEKAWMTVALKSKEAVLSISTKLVYRLKITSLKTDNFFSRLLKDIKLHKSGMGEEIKKSPFKIQLTSLADTDESDFEPNIDSGRPETEVKVSFAKQENQLINQLAYNPKDVSAYKRLGWLYLENNRPIEARQALKMAVKLGSKDKMVVTKLLEVGGVVHKEGVGPAAPSAAANSAKRESLKAVLTQEIAQLARTARVKNLKSKPKKIRLKKV